jgi:hypothetical protein
MCFMLHATRYPTSMPLTDQTPLITPKGLKYAGIYLLVFVLPFVIMYGQAGMTAIIIKTYSFITLPVPLLIWLFSPEFFHNHYWTLISLNVMVNLLLLVWIGKVISSKKSS